MKLQGKVAIVTGAATGIGKAIAMGMARREPRSSSTTSARPIWPMQSSAIFAARQQGDGHRSRHRRPAQVNNLVQQTLQPWDGWIFL